MHAQMRDGWVAGLLLLLGACAPESPPVRSAPPPSVQRLTQLAEPAHVVRSPLLDPPAETLTAMPVYREDFSDFDPSRLGWPADGPVATRRPDGAGQALRVADPSSGRTMFVVPVQSETEYRVSRSIRVQDDTRELLLYEVTVTEAEDATHGERIEALSSRVFLKPARLVHKWRFPTPEPARWQADTLEFRTSETTGALVFLLEDFEGIGPVGEVWIDDLVVEQLSVDEDASVVRAVHDGEPLGPLGELGLGLRGQLLPMDALYGRYTTLDTLYAPTPTTLTIPVQVPDGGRLRFSYGLGQRSKPGDAVRFRVRVGGTEVFSQLVRAEQARGRPTPSAQVDLSAWANTTVELTLETESLTGGPAHAFFGDPVVSRGRDEQTPPNVVLIAIDTLRADRLSSYGADRATSPSIDALADHGIRFAQATSPSNWTASTFAALFTGLYPSEHEVIFYTRALHPDLYTLAERFAAAGWRTAGVAHKPYLYNMNFDQGFDRWMNLPQLSAKGGDNLRQALLWLNELQDEPFFLFVHLNDPHQPFNHPTWFQDRFADPQLREALDIDLPHAIRRTDHHSAPPEEVPPELVEVTRALYDEEIVYTDSIVGDLLAALDAHGLTEDTIVAVVSDHGEQLWEHRRWGHGGPMLTDGLTRVPLIIKPAARSGLPSGRVVDSQVRTLDLGPTLLELAGAPTTPYGDAHSLMPHWKEAQADVLAISENIRSKGLSVRTTDWKLSVRPELELDSPPVEVFVDLRADPSEQSTHTPSADVLQTARAALVAHVTQRRAGPFVVAVGDPSQHTAFRLAAQGDTRLEPVLVFGVDDDGLTTEGTARWLGVARVEGDLSAVSGWRDGVPEGLQVTDELQGSRSGLFVLPGEGGVGAFTPPGTSGEQTQALIELGYIED